MWHISAHQNIILFYHSYSTNVLSILVVFLDYLILCSLWSHLWIILILLSLYYITSKHLRVFNLNLRVVKYEIIIVYVLYYFYGLVLVFFLWFRRSTSSNLRTIYSLIYPTNMIINVLSIILLLILFISLIKLINLMNMISLISCSLYKIFISKYIILLFFEINIFLFFKMLRFLIQWLFCILLINYFTRIIIQVIFIALCH